MTESGGTIISFVKTSVTSPSLVIFLSLTEGMIGSSGGSILGSAAEKSNPSKPGNTNPKSTATTSSSSSSSVISSAIVIVLEEPAESETLILSE
jgi:hypothetical protein